MSTNSRTKNSIKNSITGSASQFISTILNFLVRTIFIYYLTEEYLGINGLFSNILYVLNFAELGIGHAIVYKLYKPVAEDNKERIKSLINLYKKISIIIGFTIFILGISLIPFLEYIIKEPPKIKENLNLLYCLFLLETIGPYFFGYKRYLLLVNQKNYINNIIELIFSITKSILQILILVFTKNYILYLIIYITSTIFSNIYISIYINKKYPFLKEKNIEKIKREELRELWNNVKALFAYKIGNTVLSGTDNIILSMTSGISAVGIYSNYSLIITAINKILWTILTGLTGSIGNINATKTKEKQEETFNQSLLISCILYGSGCVCLAVLLNPFITIWIGKKYILDELTITIAVLVYYLRGISYPADTYRDTLGLFNEGKFIPLICAIINIILSFILGNKLGIKGVFLATIISIIATTFWYMPKLIYKKIFNKSIIYFIKKILIYTIPFIISYIISNKLILLFNHNTIINFIIQTIITITCISIITIAMLYHTDEFKKISKKILNAIIK